MNNMPNMVAQPRGTRSLGSSNRFPLFEKAEKRNWNFNIIVPKTVYWDFQSNPATAGPFASLLEYENLSTLGCCVGTSVGSVGANEGCGTR